MSAESDWWDHVDACEECRPHPYPQCPVGVALYEAILAEDDDDYRCNVYHMGRE